MAKILIIDDDPDTHAIYRAFLKGTEYTVDSVTSGEEGCKVVVQGIDKDSRYAIIVLDMMMPGWDGLKTLAEIRKFDRLCEVVMITNYANPMLYSDIAALSLNTLCMDKNIGKEQFLMVMDLLKRRYDAQTTLFAATDKIHKLIYSNMPEALIRERLKEE